MRKPPSTWRTARQLDLLSGAPREQQESFAFAVIGDAEPGRFFWNRILFGMPNVFFAQLRSIAREPVDFILQLGDMVSEGKTQYYASFLKGLDLHCPKIPYLTVLGNHDRRDPHSRSDANQYRTHFGEPNYYFDRGPARFVVVDTSAEGLRESQMRWLDKVLDTDKIKLVFMHKPPAGLKRWTAGGFGGFKARSAALMKLLSNKGVSRVYMGHIHGFGRETIGGVTYVLSGGGGSPLYPSLVDHKFYHYMVVEVGPDGVRETLQKLNGERIPLDSRRLPAKPEIGQRLRLAYLHGAAFLAVATLRIPH